MCQQIGNKQMCPLHSRKEQKHALEIQASVSHICYCKVMESILKDTMTEHMERNNLINQSQHGFMKGKSCTTNLLQFLETVTACINRGESFDIVYLYLFAKAFDKVTHKRLIKKMCAPGISSNILRGGAGCRIANKELP